MEDLSLMEVSSSIVQNRNTPQRSNPSLPQRMDHSLACGPMHPLMQIAQTLI